MDIKRVSVEIDGKEYILETGKLANQAHGSVWVQCGDTVVLVTAVSQPFDKELDFMPLTVEYLEMSYAAGRIPSSYFRREIGRPSEREVLVSRLIDRPLRPLFPKGYKDEVQIIATVLSADPELDPDVLSVIGASTALHISPIPFLGPVACGRIGFIDENFVLNPTSSELQFSKINIVIAATKDAVVMVEGEAQFASEDLILEAIVWGHEKLKPFLEIQEELREKAGKEKIEIPVKEPDPELEKFIREKGYDLLKEALFIPEKIKRRETKKEVEELILKEVTEHYPEDPEKVKEASEIIKDIEKSIITESIRNHGKRIDGRGLTDIRELFIEVGVLPRVHGSAIFARGETKALGIATLGGTQDEQHIETLSGEISKRFMVHYNFPPYSVGETKKLRGPSRREIGHGFLAERSLQPVLPDQEEFPFTIRIVSEIMESNGSSSMATVCAGSLALMDAGVPTKAPVAGVAMGLIKDNEDYFILTDILGDEDHLGDMDFKIAGTKDGITGIQMDIKISGIPEDVLHKALLQAKDARLYILDEMCKVLDKPRSTLSEHAPKMKIIEVDPDRIKDIIGPAGKTIKSIIKDTGASIDIEETGKITVFAPNSKALDEAVERILFYDQKPELGKNYVGRVKSVRDFGAIVQILPGVEGLVHISQLSLGKVTNIYKMVKPGDEIKVKVIEIEKDTGRVKLSRKAVLLEEQGKKFIPPKKPIKTRHPSYKPVRTTKTKTFKS